MDWLQFIAAMVASLAWPVTLLIILLWLTKNLPLLFPFIEAFKYKDFEVRFRNAVQEMAVESKSAFPAQPEEDDRPLDVRDQLFQLAEISPRSAILEAWLNVEAWAIRRLQSLPGTSSEKLKNMAPLRLGKLLEESKILTPSQMLMFHRLRDLRNQAVHVAEAKFSVEVVLEYVDLALSLARAIRASSHPAHVSNRV